MVSDSLNLKDPLVKEFIINNSGKDAYNITLTLDKGKTDEQISKKTKLKVNDIRAQLNKLHYLGIIYYTKEKAKESNWYTYTWFVKRERVRELIRERAKEEVQKLEDKLTFEGNYVFFKCKNGCEKLQFELAFEYDFKCPECSAVMTQVDSEKEKKALQKKINGYRKFVEKK